MTNTRQLEVRRSWRVANASVPYAVGVVGVDTDDGPVELVATRGPLEELARIVQETVESLPKEPPEGVKPKSAP